MSSTNPAVAAATVGAAAQPQAKSALRRRVERISIPVLLGVFVVVSAAFRYVQLAGRMPAAWIFPDELIYSELAKSLGTTGHFAIRDVPFSDLSFGIAYPALLAPAYALTDSLPDAYAVARAINSFVMALAAIPAYLLAVRVLRPGLALLAAMLAIQVPSMAYSGTIMSENLFYPVFLLTVLVIVRALERPTRWRQLAVFAAIGFAVLTRLEAVAFVPAYLSAIGIACWTDARANGSRERALVRMKAFALTGGILGGSALALLAFQMLRGEAVTGLLGAYESVLDRYALEDVPKWFVYHLADIDLYVGIVPFVAALVLSASVLRGQEQSRPVRLFVAAAMCVTLWFAALVAAYATQAPATRIHERYLFHVVPLLLIALLVWIERGPPVRTAVTVAAVLVAAVLPATIPFDVVVSRNIQASTPGLVPWGGLSRTLEAPGYAWALALGLGIAVGIAVLVVRRNRLVVWTAAVIVTFAVTGFFVAARYSAISRSAADWGSPATKDWIDRAVGQEAEVAAIWSGRFSRGLEGRYSIWENEMFNHAVGPVYDLREPLKRYVPETRVRVRASSGVLENFLGEPVSADYVLTDKDFPVIGRVVARDAHTGVVLYAVDGVVRAARVDVRT